MNWKEIKKKHPKSIAKLKEFKLPIPGTKYGLYRFSSYFQSERLLYDFFDKNDILIIVEPEIQYTGEYDKDNRVPHYVPKEWGYTIHDLAYWLATKFPFNSRAEAEEAAFNESFCILEEKLNNE